MLEDPDKNIVDSSSTEPLRTPSALPPFTSSSYTDIVLRSSDGVEFHVVKAILSLASPFFADMFSLPQNNASIQETSGDKDVNLITFTERSEVVDILLRLCYPISDPELKTLDIVQEALLAAVKYDVVIAQERLRATLVTYAKQAPVTVYAFACQYGLEPEARTAARESLHFPITAIFLSHADELRTISGTAFQRLLAYHHACQQVAIIPAKTWAWFNNIPRQFWATATTQCCTHAGYSDGHGHYYATKPWFLTYMNNMSVALANQPHGDTVKSTSALNSMIVQASNCPTCRQHAYDQLTEFADLFADEVNRKTGEIKLDFVSCA